MSDQELDRLLARGRMGGPGRERVLSDLVGKRRAARRRRLALLLGGPMLAMAAVLVLYLRPSGDGFRARGDGDGPLIDVSCKGGVCARGSTLVFRVDGASSGGYLIAWAEPVGGGARIWYFASETPRLMAQPEPQVVPFGVQIGPEQPPGEYEIHALVTAEPPARDQVRAPVVRRLTVTR